MCVWAQSTCVAFANNVVCFIPLRWQTGGVRKSGDNQRKVETVVPSNSFFWLVWFYKKDETEKWLIANAFCLRFSVFACVFEGMRAWKSKCVWYVACKCLSPFGVVFIITCCLRWCVQPFCLFHFLTLSFRTLTSLKSNTFRCHCQVFF